MDYLSWASFTSKLKCRQITDLSVFLLENEEKKTLNNLSF